MTLRSCESVGTRRAPTALTVRTFPSILFTHLLDILRARTTMATDIGPITATSASLVRLLTAGPSRVSLDGDVIRLGNDAGIPVGAVDGIETRRSWLWTRMTVRTAKAGERSIGGLRRDAAARLAEAVSEEAVCVAERMSTVLIELDERLARFHAADRYRRDSRSRALQEEIANAVHRVRGKLARCRLPPDAAGALSRIAPLASEEAFEAAREEANSRYVSGCAPAVARAASGVLSAPPTEEQATAIATEEDATLVLAGAGTGKTAVITGKVAHLVRNRGVPPREILVLAFNRKAAEEIRERLPGDLAGAHVHTFHSFGRRVIADVGVAPTVSKLAEDDALLVAATDRILLDLLADPEQSDAIATFIARHRVVYRSQFEFETPGEYHRYVRRFDRRALSGDLVKSNPPPAAGRCSELLTGVGERRRMVRGEA